MRAVLVRFVRFIEVILGCSKGHIGQSRNKGLGAHPKDVTFTADNEPSRRFSMPLMRTTYGAPTPWSH
jgi:hypothetical protein